MRKKAGENLEKGLKEGGKNRKKAGKERLREGWK